MAKELQATVHGLVDPETGERHSFGPGDTLPGWAVDMVANPAAVGVDEDADDDGLSALAHEQDDEDPSEGTIDEVLERVGTDKGRAKATLEAEESKGAKARTTLLSELRAILGAD